MYSEIMVGTGKDSLMQWQGKPWHEVKAQSGLTMTSEAAMLPQKDRDGRYVDTRPREDFYQQYYLPVGQFALRSIVSGGQNVAGLFLQNF